MKTVFGGSAFLPGPMEGVMQEPFLLAANHLQLIPCWITPFFRLSTALPRRKLAMAFLAPYLSSGLHTTVQLMGTDPGLLAEAAELFVQCGAAGIDLNFGCPSRQVTSGKAGGGALQTPENMKNILSRIRQAVPDIPLTAKFRSGWQSPEELPVIAGALLDNADALVFHYRTVQEQYRSGIADREKRFETMMTLAGDTPVYLNGDMNTPEDCRDTMQRFSPAGVMCARGWLRDPGLLKRCAGKTDLPPETFRRLFFREILDCAGSLMPGKAMELSNFFWGRENPFFEILKTTRTPITPEWLHEQNF